MFLDDHIGLTLVATTLPSFVLIFSLGMCSSGSSVALPETIMGMDVYFPSRIHGCGGELPMLAPCMFNQALLYSVCLLFNGSANVLSIRRVVLRTVVQGVKVASNTC